MKNNFLSAPTRRTCKKTTTKKHGRLFSPVRIGAAEVAGQKMLGGILAVDVAGSARMVEQAVSPVGTVIMQTTDALQQKMTAFMALQAAEKKASSLRRTRYEVRPLSPPDRRKVYNFPDQKLAEYGMSLGSDASFESTCTEEEVLRLWQEVRADVIQFQKELFAFRELVFLQLDSLISKIAKQRWIWSEQDCVLAARLAEYASWYQALEEYYLDVVTVTARDFKFGVIAKHCVTRKYTNSTTLPTLLHSLMKHLESMFMQFELPECALCHKSLNVTEGETTCCGRRLIFLGEDADRIAAKLTLFSVEIKEKQNVLMGYVPIISGASSRCL